MPHADRPRFIDPITEYVSHRFVSVWDLVKYAACPTVNNPFLRVGYYIFFILLFPFILCYWYVNETKIVFNMKDNGDVLLTKFIGKFKHNYSQTIEAFTDGRQNDVDLIDISLTWHMKGIHCKIPQAHCHLQYGY